MIIEILEEKKDFTYSETLIANYILDNPNTIYQLSADELGKMTYTSCATVFVYVKS